MATNGDNGGTKKREQTALRIIDAIHKAQGLLTLASSSSGIGYRTICRYVQEYPSVKEASIEAKEHMIDFAESKLYQNIKDGDNACIIFYLKTQAKHRGYIERAEVSGIGGEPIRYEINAKDSETKDLTVRIIKGGSVVSHIGLS
jgi:hypothetical protein